MQCHHALSLLLTFPGTSRASAILVPQATVPLALFRDARPHYLWLPLRRPAPPAVSSSAAAAAAAGQSPRKSPSPGQGGSAARNPTDHPGFNPSYEPGGEPAAAGELRVRVQWAPEDAPGGSSAGDALALELVLSGVGVSIVEASVTRLPREVGRRPCVIGWR